MSPADPRAPAPALPGARPRGRKRRALVAIVIGCLTALAGAELVCRVVWGAPLAEREPLMEVRANATRGYEMIPGTDHYTYLHPVHVNAFGLRGPERTPRGADETRVLCLGDSFVYGQGVAEADTISAQLERALERRRGAGARPAAVWNGGHRAYNTEQELALLAELAPRLAPDVVVLVWYPNDLEETDVAGAARRLAESGPITFDTGARFEGAVARNWRLKQLVRHSALAMRLHDLAQDWRTAAPVSGDGVERGYTRLGDSLARFAALARTHDFDALVAVLPDSASVARDEEFEDRAAPSAAARVLALAADAGVAAVDLLPALRAQRRRDGRLHVLAYDGHYDGRAYAAVAEQLADELEHRFARRLGR